MSSITTLVLFAVVFAISLMSLHRLAPAKNICYVNFNAIIVALKPSTEIHIKRYCDSQIPISNVILTIYRRIYCGIIVKRGHSIFHQ